MGHMSLGTIRCCDATLMDIMIMTPKHMLATASRGFSVMARVYKKLLLLSFLMYVDVVKGYGRCETNLSTSVRPLS